MAERRSRPAARPLAAALGALALAGCAADHVGEDWQCPLAQGSVCASVGAADPAVPEARVPPRRLPAARDMETPALDTSLVWPPAQGGVPGIGATDEPDCDSACGPLTWLARPFDGPAGDDGIGPHVDGPASRADDARVTNGTVPAAIVATAPEAVVPARDGEPNRGVRAPETVARIWIAPWVDADGIYREGALGACGDRAGSVEAAVNLARRLMDLFEGPSGLEPWAPPATGAALAELPALGRPSTSAASFTSTRARSGS